MNVTTHLGINTALSGLQAYQAAIATTGENIANADTPGYTRQRVELGESDPLTIRDLSRNTGAGAQVGTGVSIDDIARVRDAFLDIQYRAQSSSSGHDSTLSAELAQVQTALGDSSGAGVSSALQKFFSAFNSLSSSNSPAAQAAVLGAAQTLAQTLNAVSKQMGTVQSQASSHLDSLTAVPGGQIAQDASQIATLNTQIKTQVAAGITPNDLLDQRDKLLDDLSSLGQTTATEDTNGDGGVTVSFGGQSLVAADGTVTVPTSAQVIANPSAYGGSAGALGQLADTGPNGVISKLSAQLDTVATTLSGAVNHDLGDQPFFTGTGAGDIAVGSTAATILSGATAAQTSAVAAESSSVTGTYAAFVGSVGTAVQSAQNAASTSASLLSAVDSRRQSVSGVSLDEEMANLITFQQGYQASARMMSTMDTVIGTLINVVGGSGL